MMIDKKAVRLLILEDSQNEAERIVSLFRNAGQATRVHRVADEDDLTEALKQSWDLCIAAAECEDLHPQQALKVILQTGRELSFIQLLEDNDSDSLTEALQLGAQDAVPQGEDERLILVARRELHNLSERRARRTAELALRETEKRCQLLLDSSIEAISYVHDGMHIYTNRAYLQLFGYSDAEELEGMPMIDLITSEDQARFKEFLKSYRGETGSADFDCSGVTATNQPFAAKMSFSPAQYDGEPCVQVVIRTDQNNAELEAKLREISNQDSVTGLYNRQRFLELIDTAAERSLNQGETASLAYIKIDNYAQLAKEHGIAGIDHFLAALADVLKKSLSPDTQIARLADNVFCTLKPQVLPEQQREELDALRLKVEGQLFEINGRTAQTTLSIGAAALTEKTSKASEVLDRARRCCDDSSNGTGNALRIHNPADDLAAAASSGNIVAMIQQALATNSFRLLFQPIISLRGDKEEQYEVLLRLINPQGEEVAPNDFLNAAITAGLAEKIDRWVLLNAIKLLSEHRNKGHQTQLFVHLSSPSLMDPALLPWLTVALNAARLPPHSLIIQIRETDAITHLKQVKQLTEGLRKLHCQIAIGQFGCAVNPFGMLNHLEVDFIKVDGSFTAELNDPEQQETLKEMLNTLHAQKKKTIVPFVESAAILSVLWQAGVHYIQGHYFQAPSSGMNYDFNADDQE